MIQVDANHVGEIYMKQTVQCVILTKSKKKSELKKLFWKKKMEK